METKKKKTRSWAKEIAHLTVNMAGFAQKQINT
jgi:hypothetical protein